MTALLLFEFRLLVSLAVTFLYPAERIIRNSAVNIRGAKGECILDQV